MSDPTSARPTTAPADAPVSDLKSRGARALPVVLLVTLAGLAIAINQVFLIRAFGFQIISTGYYFLLLGLFIGLAFLFFPARAADRARIPFYDWIAAAATLGSGVYFAVHAETIISQGWDFAAPALPTVLSFVFFFAVMEVLRRAGGRVLFVVCVLFAFYPLFADHMPGVLWGTHYSLEETMLAHVMGVESIVGITTKILCELLVGYLLFGATLTATGGGQFFMDFAAAVMGRSRGGPAKVAVIASGMFGSLSGSVISNVISTGSFTIPTMKRAGYPPVYAAAIESNASTGGAIMPPVMGAVAFIMASFLNVPYGTVIEAAVIPALLFYLVLIIQVDTYAARVGLTGLPEAEIPALWPTVKEGWPHLLGLGLLVVLILAFEMDRTAPFWASGAMLAVALLRDHRNLWGTLRAVLFETGHSVAYLFAVLAGIGLIVGSLSITGVGNSFSRELVQYADGSVTLLLTFGAITSFVLGMGMTVSACYIFLSIILAPALVAGGLDEMASHLFILYWGMLSFITPPVSMAAVTAAGIAGCSGMKAGFMAMRLGAVLFVLPFAFVLNPALIGRGGVTEVALSVTTAVVAVWLIGCGFERYLHGRGPLGRVESAAVLTGGLLMLVPEVMTDLAGFALAMTAYLPRLMARRGTTPL
ncbi:MAG: TRAP transporter permease [Kiloniellaceae bacterium]